MSNALGRHFANWRSFHETEPEVPVKQAVCSSCRNVLHLFMSHGMDHDGNKFDTPMYSPCQTCLRLEHMRGMSDGIIAILEKESDP